jgi:chromosome segregation ATPase
MKEIEELVSKSSQGPSTFQLRYFVIGKEPTAQAKMHKCIEEMRVRLTAINQTKSEIEEVTDNIEILHQNSETSEIAMRQIGRKIRSATRHLEGLHERIKVWQFEIDFLKEEFDKIEKKVPLQEWNSFEVQLEYWNEKLSQDIRNRMMMNLPVDAEVIKTVLALPDAAPIKRQLVEHANKAIENTNKIKERK